MNEKEKPGNYIIKDAPLTRLPCPPWADVSPSPMHFVAVITPQSWVLGLGTKLNLS